MRLCHLKRWNALRWRLSAFTNIPQEKTCCLNRRSSMNRPLSKPLTSSQLSRVIADFLMVHTCLVFTLVSSWIRGTRGASEAILMIEAHDAIDHYLHLFLPLSLVFPAVFFLNGVYRDHQTWSLSHRVM